MCSCQSERMKLCFKWLSCWARGQCGRHCHRFVTDSTNLRGRRLLGFPFYAFLEAKFSRSIHSKSLDFITQFIPDYLVVLSRTKTACQQLFSVHSVDWKQDNWLICPLAGPFVWLLLCARQSEFSFTPGCSIDLKNQAYFANFLVAIQLENESIWISSAILCSTCFDIVALKNASTKISLPFPYVCNLCIESHLQLVDHERICLRFYTSVCACLCESGFACVCWVKTLLFCVATQLQTLCSNILSRM